MKLKMNENSLFAILLRSPWWISFLIAAVIGLIASVALPGVYAPYAAFAGGPFILIGCMAAWKQLRQPSAARVAGILDAVGAMSWRDFAGALEQGFVREGYTVARLDGPGADFEIARAGRTALVSCKRWKAAKHGIEPLRDLQAAAERRGVQQCIYVATGEVSDNARRFAAEKKIDLLQDVRLAQLLRGVRAAGKS